MKVEIKFKVEPIEVIISEEITDRTAKEYLTEIIEFIRENTEFIENAIAQEDLHKSEISVKDTSLIDEVRESEFPEEIISLAKALMISPEDVSLILKTEKKMHDVFPLAIIPKGNTRTKIQRPAVTILLYQNYVLNKNRNLTSKKIVDLLEDTMIDAGELNKAANNHPYVDQKGQTYSINAKGTTDASKIFQELIDQVK